MIWIFFLLSDYFCIYRCSDPFTPPPPPPPLNHGLPYESKCSPTPHPDHIHAGYNDCNHRFSQRKRTHLLARLPGEAETEESQPVDEHAGDDHVEEVEERSSRQVDLDVDLAEVPVVVVLHGRDRHDLLDQPLPIVVVIYILWPGKTYFVSRRLYSHSKMKSNLYLHNYNNYNFVKER